MRRLADLTRVALLGVERAEIPSLEPAANSPDSALDALLAQVADQDPAAALLNAAGIIGIYARAGVGGSQQPRAEPMAPTPPGVRGRVCPPSAVFHLNIMLEGRQAHLLDELLLALTAGGYAIPAPLLPVLLDRGAKRPQQRPVIIGALSPLDRHYAYENPVWRYASPQIDDYEGLRAIWRATTDLAERRGLLRQARVRNPDWGRRLLEGSWKSLQDRERHALFEHLRPGLSDRDEPFLEMALDDRSQPVRRKAAELLGHLPASRLAHRMAARMSEIVRYTPDGEHRIEIAFPPALDAATVRDGVLERSGKNLAHLRGLRLIEMVSAVPLDHWSTMWAIGPADVVLAMRASLWPRTLTQALCLAAVRQGNADWAAALLDATELHEHALRAAPALSLAECDRLLNRWDATLSVATPLSKDAKLIQLLRQRSGPWSVAMTRRLWHQLASQPPVDDQRLDHAVSAVVKQMGANCPPHLLEEGLALFDRLPATTQEIRAVREAKNTMTFRHRMLHELSIDN
jgi:hypothetical protein